MQTPAILTPTSAAQGSKPAAKQADAASSDVTFNQVLSREIEDRRNASASASENNKTAVKETDNAPAPQQATTSATSTTSTTKSAKSTDEEKSKVETDSTDPAAASDELLALVANLGQVITAPTDTRTPATTATTSAATPGMDAAQQAIDVVGKADLSADTNVAALKGDGTSATPTDKEATLKPGTDFATAITRANDAKPALDLKNAKVQPDSKDSKTPLDLKDVKAQPDLKEDKVPLDLKNVKAAPDPKESKAQPDLKEDKAPLDFKNAMASADSTSSKTQELSRESAATDKLALDLVARTQEASPGISATAMSTLQQANLNMAQGVAGHATDKLTPPVGTAAWDQALGQKVVWMVAGEHQSASLTLNPPDLGPLQVVLNVSNSQANATFIAAQPEVRQALEAAMPKLREMLGEAGIQLGQATVNAGTPNQQGAPGEQPQRNARGFAPADSQVDTAIRPTLTRQVSAGQGLVDTFA